jgi:hypothetical protein
MPRTWLDRRRECAQMTRAALDDTRLTKYFLYSKMEGCFNESYLDDEFFSREQELFFRQYELQMMEAAE